jgi:acetyl esterase/lipase
MNLVGWKSYLGKTFGTDQVSAYAAPARRENCEGLPEAWIGVGDVELFYDEDKAYANKLTAAGVACKLDTVSGAPHAFEGLAPDSDLAKEYLSRAKTWLKSALSA